MDKLFNPEFQFLDYIINNEMFIVCPPLPTARFIDFCNKRGIRISRKQLEKFEKLGIFFPLARVQHPKIQKKIVHNNDGTRYRELGVLMAGETWEGEIKQEYGHFWFEKEYAMEWRKEGLLWDPVTRPFKKWDTFRDDSGRTYVESYYSIFQCYTLSNLVKLLAMSLQFENVVSYSDDVMKNLLVNLRGSAEQAIKFTRENGMRGGSLPFICQIISNRYFPKTQTDRRTIRISKSRPYYNWDWDKYCADWKSKVVLEEVGTDINTIKGAQELLSLDARSCDPLERWYNLVAFVAVDKKAKLKDKALLAQTIYSMEMMMRLFYQDITNSKLDKPNEDSNWKEEHFYGEGVPKDELVFLEYLANEYHLNPRPNLILVVEGDGEEEQFPKLAEELFDVKFSTSGIELQNLRGIDNFTGSKRKHPYGTLERYIDDYHRRGTVVFVVLDNESRVNAIRDKLTTKASKYFGNRSITKKEYIHLWERKTIEFDNFNYKEISKAMTELTDNERVFSPTDIEICFNRMEPRSFDALSELYRKRTGHGLNKRQLLDNLFNQIITKGKCKTTRDEVLERPVVALLKKIIEIAHRNHKPTTLTSYSRNQEVDFFGDYI